MINTPELLIINNDVFSKIHNVTKKLYNDMDLGREVRKIISEYEKSQTNSHK